jgi:hypothetical protein
LKIYRRGKTNRFATTIAAAVPANKLDSKAVFFGSKTIDDIAQGKMSGEQGLNAAVVYNLVNGKVKNEVIAGMDASAIERMFKVGTDTSFKSGLNTEEGEAFDANVEALRHTAYEIMHNPILNRSASKSAKDVLKKYMVKPRESRPPRQWPSRGPRP